MKEKWVWIVYYIRYSEAGDFDIKGSTGWDSQVQAISDLNLRYASRQLPLPEDAVITGTEAYRKSDINRQMLDCANTKIAISGVLDQIDSKFSFTVEIISMS